MHLFADLALATSFLGVALGLLIIWQICFSVQIPLVDDCKLCNYLSAATGVCTVLSTRICVALGYAGVALAVLALIIPSL